MTSTRTIGLDSLRRHLRHALGADSLLYRRFDMALRIEDVRLVETTMDSLRLYPQEVRAKVERVLLHWLFGDIAMSN